MSLTEIVRIVMVATGLIALLVLQKPCAHSVSKFVTDFGAPDAGAIGRDGGSPDALQGVRLRADMTPEQMAAAIALAKAVAGVATDGGAALDANVSGH